MSGDGIVPYYLKSVKLPTPAEMIQPRYDPEFKLLITQQQQPMYEIRQRVALAKQSSRHTILVQPRYKWRLFRNHHNKLKKATTCSHQKKLKNHRKKLKNHQNLMRLLFQNDVGQTVRMKHCSLDDKEFYQYVANDAHLLNNFLKYKLAADQCEDDSDKASFLGWSSYVKQELERNNSIVEQKLGLNPKKETTLHPATAKYKEFLLGTASGNVHVYSEIPIHQSKIHVYTLGAMTPSLRIYAFLTKAMQKLVSPYVNSHPYSKWSKEYSYEIFKTPYLHSEDMSDELCGYMTDKEVEAVERLYCQAMRFEMDFLNSRQSEHTLIIPIYSKLDPKERLILFADFDFTCTDLGSLGILEYIAIMTAQKADQLLQGQDRNIDSHITSTDLKNTWELLSQQATVKYDKCMKKIMLAEKALSFNYHRLHSALVELSSSEEQVISRIFDSGVLKGISLEDIKQAGKYMILQNGCMNFFKKVNKLDASVNIMSCWSEELTRSSLSGTKSFFTSETFIFYLYRLLPKFRCIQSLILRRNVRCYLQILILHVPV
ncbi:hypothetical protein MKX03_012948 [Papaver bracteatum]|nr:hypothetical protein MKX03_012948 [Papaver bracteatum]